MPDPSLSLAWHEAALALETRIRELTGQAPERLDRAAVSIQYQERPNFVAGWRFKVAFSDVDVRRFDVLATAAFPTVPVRTALVDRPPYMTWPHVEHDGILCLLPNMSECDPDNPVEVAINLAARSTRLVSELLEGAIVERDFREEFLTYWAYKACPSTGRLISLIDPGSPSRTIYVWAGKGYEIVGDDPAVISAWVRNRWGDSQKVECEKAAYIWLGDAPLPNEYPELASDLRAIAKNAGVDATDALNAAAIGEPDHLVAILGANGRGGPGIVAVKVSNPKLIAAKRWTPADPVSKG